MTMKKKKTSAGNSLRYFLIVLLSVMAAELATAAEIRSVTMEKKDGGFYVHAESWLDAAPEFVFAVLLDYDEFHRLTQGITATRWLDEAHGGYPLAYTRIDSCVAFFCRKLEKVEIVKVTGKLTYSTEALPERSDFLNYTSTWMLRSDDQGTRIDYEMIMQPDFWVPPLIGPWAIRRKAESSALKIAQRIEYLAAHRMALDEFDLEKYLATD